MKSNLPSDRKCAHHCLSMCACGCAWAWGFTGRHRQGAGVVLPLLSTCFLIYAALSISLSCFRPTRYPRFACAARWIQPWIAWAACASLFTFACQWCKPRYVSGPICLLFCLSETKFSRFNRCQKMLLISKCNSYLLSYSVYTQRRIHVFTLTDGLPDL